MTTQQDKPQLAVEKDKHTLDVFNHLSDEEINNIATKILFSAKIQKRFGAYATIEYVRDFLIKLLSSQPELTEVLSRWKNYKHKVKTA
ncbi:hypothetical protein [Acinetobacter sp. P1(2025)]|uniref:hypothetical protein n=1 Tax=Acinetobacter sp. P1(2025) TaxID=3446120 RepID=UPI003F529371